MSETVKLIVEIPKTTYEDLKAGKIYSSLCEAPQGLIEGIRNGIPLDDVKAEIAKKAFTEEIFDEDIFRSIYTESMTSEEAEDESVIETEIVKLSDILDILDNIGKGDKK